MSLSLRTFLTASLGAFGFLQAESEDWSAWEWEASFQVVREGAVRLEIPPKLLDVCRRDFGDVRIVSPAGVETPWIADEVEIPEAGIWETRDFKATIEQDKTLIVANHKTEAVEPERIDGFELITAAPVFLKSVTVEGRGGDVGWQGLATRELVFRQADGAERTLVPLPAGPWNEFKVTVDDSRSERVEFTGARLHQAHARPETVVLPVSAGPLERLEGGRSAMTLDLGAKNLHVSTLRFDIPEALFSRPVTLSYRLPTPDGGERIEALAKGVLFRVDDGTGRRAEELSIGIHRRVPTREVTVTFHDGEGPPLGFAKAAVHVHPTRLRFQAAETGLWRVISDNPGAKSPDYDVESLDKQTKPDNGSTIHPRQIRRNPDFIPPQPLTGVEIAGKKIDLANWARQRPLEARPGVLRIELDEQVLAFCRTDLGDLRLVQQGLQIPYLISRESARREVKTTLKLLPSPPQRPSVSRWEVSLPVDGLPAHALSASSPAPEFHRRFLATIERKDALGNRWNQEIGSAEWIKTPEKNRPLSLAIRGERLPASFILETDHGESPPVVLENVVVRYDAPILVAKVSDTAPVFLCYGNPKAEAPHYDLELLKAELLEVSQQPAALAEEEILKPSAALSADAGSPWLWVSLGAVAIALLTLVAKLLPRQ